MKKLKPNREPLKADYQGATPKQVAEAVLRYRGPDKPVRHIRKPAPVSQPE